jgi:Tol biopolymer transport system component
MNKRFVRQALEEYAAHHMPPSPDLWPAIRGQVRPAVPAPQRRLPLNHLGRVVLPTVILLGLVAVALALGPVFSRAGLLSSPDAGAGNAPGPALTPIAPPVTAPPLASQLYVMNADGTNPIQRTSAAENRHYQPAWSPDGRRIAFGVSTADGYAIYTMNVDGSDLLQIVPSSRNAWGPVWSPDGTRLAFSAGPGQKREIYTIGADGTDEQQLTTNASDVTGLAWSPDGTRIAFASIHEGTSQIYVMQRDGANPTRLTQNTANDRNPAWAPDGSRIAFDSDRDGTSQIYVMHTDGTEQTRLTTLQGPNLAPAWSPDGQWIMFTSRRDGDSDLYQMKADGSALTNLTHSPTLDEAWGAWSPDGQQIAFAAMAARPMPPPAVSDTVLPTPAAPQK